MQKRQMMKKIRSMMIGSGEIPKDSDQSVDVVFDLTYDHGEVVLIAWPYGKPEQIYELLRIKKEGRIEMISGMNSNEIGMLTTKGKGGFVIVTLEE